MSISSRAPSGSGEEGTGSGGEGLGVLEEMLVAVGNVLRAGGEVASAGGEVSDWKKLSTLSCFPVLYSFLITSSGSPLVCS